ncbi:Threonylcarbamoyl-AMP synthase [bioreactor metagenome]|uniref:Threonylcarbamoyl-AMP synthase n=1 Tax=bioreactor metagenome TaxID=1076179 RepID=A0A645G926_9ZZZZ
MTFEELKELCPDIEADPAVRGKLPDGQRPLAPGMKYRHYAPKAQIIAVKGREEKILSYFKEKLLNGAGILCYDEDKLILPSSENAISFGAKNDKNAQAAQLFERLREFDLKPVSVIYTRYPDDTGLGLAVFNRLLKACGFDTVNADLL